MEDRVQQHLAPMGVLGMPTIADKVSAFIELPGDNMTVYSYARKDGNIHFSASGNYTGGQYTAPGGEYSVGVLDSELNIIATEKIVWKTRDPDAYGDRRLALIAMDEDKYGISNDGNSGACKLVCDDSFNAVRLYPTHASQESWWYAESWFYPEYGGLLYLDPDLGCAYLGVRVAYTRNNTVNNSLIKFNYQYPTVDNPKSSIPPNSFHYNSSLGKVIQEERVIKGIDTSNTWRFWMHRSADKVLHVITEDKEYQRYDVNLNLLSKSKLNPEIANPLGFCVYNDVLVLLYSSGYNLRVDFRMMDAEQSLIKSVAVNEFYRNNSGFNTRIFYLKDGFFFQNGHRIFKISATFN